MIVFPPSSQLMIAYPHEKKKKDLDPLVFWWQFKDEHTRERKLAASRNNSNRVTIWFVQQEADQK